MGVELIGKTKTINEAMLGLSGSYAGSSEKVDAPSGKYIVAIVPEGSITVTAQTDKTGYNNQDLTVFTSISNAKYGAWESVTITGEASLYFADFVG